MQGNICQKHIMKRTITRILLTILATAFALPGLAADCSAPMPVAIAPDTIAKLKQARADINDDTFTKGFHRPSQWGQRINLSFSAVTDAGLARLAKYDQLSRLDLSYMNITDAGLQHVAKLKKLIELTLTDTPHHRRRTGPPGEQQVARHPPYLGTGRYPDHRCRVGTS